MHLAQARAGYARWGAHAKVRAMARQYPMLAARAVTQAVESADASRADVSDSAGMRASAAPATARGGDLDLASVAKTAHAIAAADELDGLLSRLMRIAIENAGAERGALVLEGAEGPTVHAVDGPDGGLPIAPAPLERSERVPAAVVNYVRRTASSVVIADAIADAEADERYGADPYFGEVAPRSLLCAPALSHGRLVGVLYLENRRVAGAFTAERVQVLQSLAAQAAIALENARLRRDLEAENSYLRRDLIANVSHDLRTPLMSIRGYLEVLASRDAHLDAGVRREYLDIALRQSENLGTLIDELFELAKLDFKGATLVTEAFRLDELASDVLQKFRLLADSRGIDLALEADAALPAVEADLGLIERVFDNLIGNALKHTPAGGHIAVSLREQAGGVCASVVDDGPGIAAADLTRIFERHYRAGAQPGAGLGLAITRRILELHGASIRAEAPGVGSVFSFTLPAARG